MIRNIFILFFLIFHVNSQLRIILRIEFIKNNSFKLDYPTPPLENDFPSTIQYWKITSFTFEMGRGSVYNSRWESDVTITQPDMSSNEIVSQSFTSTKNYSSCNFSFRYSAVYIYTVYSKDGLSVSLNGNQLLKDDPIDNLDIKSFSCPVVVNSGSNILSIKAEGYKVAAYGAVFTDVFLNCSIIYNYIYICANGSYELYIDGQLFSSGTVSDTGVEIYLGESIMTNKLFEIRIISTIDNPRFLATLVYNYDNYQEYVIYTNENWIVDDLHAVQLSDTPTVNSKLDTNSRWIRSSILNTKESIFIMAT